VSISPPPPHASYSHTPSSRTISSSYSASSSLADLAPHHVPSFSFPPFSLPQTSHYLPSSRVQGGQVLRLRVHAAKRDALSLRHQVRILLPRICPPSRQHFPLLLRLPLPSRPPTRRHPYLHPLLLDRDCQTNSSQLHLRS